jgi:cardiolipin synthase
MSKTDERRIRCPERDERSSHLVLKTMAAVGAGAMVLHGARLYLKLFGPALPYGMPQPPNDPLDSDEFVRFLSITTNAVCHHDSAIEILRNGEEFYPAELDVIRHARKNVNLLFYEFLKGDVADEFIEALTERARAGVQVKLVLDAIGSFATRDSYFDGLRSAGGRMEWYRPLGWNTWTHMDNRTHRKVIIADGEIGFIGGAGVADHWMKAGEWGPAWRDTMLRVEGSAVGGLVSVFAENWVECSGEMLSGAEQFPLLSNPGQNRCLVINSTPHRESTRVRILFQTLLDCARHSIRITTPYFLPDRSVLEAMVRAMHKRNVSVQILTAGLGSDHPSLSKLSEATTVRLLKSGAEVYEYQPGMIHAKLMTIDGMWSVAGSTNFDHRSFALNDEVNIAVLDRDLAASLDKDFVNDVKRSIRRTVEMSKERSASVRLMDKLGELIRREE